MFDDHNKIRKGETWEHMEDILSSITEIGVKMKMLADP